MTASGRRGGSRRDRVGAGALGADAEALAVEADDRAPARGHRVDLHHRRPDAHARDLGVEGALEGAGVVGDVGRGTAHVEADDAVEPGERRGLGRAHDAAGRAGEDRVLFWNSRASTKPPFDCMNISRTSPASPATRST